MTRKILILAMVGVYIFMGCPSWLLDPDLLLKRAALYPLFHANIFHLLANMLAAWMIFNPRRENNNRDLIVGYIISFLVFFIAPKPVVGISNILFAVAGMRTPPFSNPWWKSSSSLVFFAVMLAMIFFPQFSAITHLVAWGTGVLIACTGRLLKSVDNDLPKQR